MMKHDSPQILLIQLLFIFFFWGGGGGGGREGGGSEKGIWEWEGERGMNILVDISSYT